MFSKTLRVLEFYLQVFEVTSYILQAPQLDCIIVLVICRQHILLMNVSTKSQFIREKQLIMLTIEQDKHLKELLPQNVTIIQKMSLFWTHSLQNISLTPKALDKDHPRLSKPSKVHSDVSLNT